MGRKRGREPKPSSRWTRRFLSPKEGTSKEMDRGVLLDWEYALLTLAVDLRKLANETRGAYTLITRKMKPPNPSLASVKTSKEPAERSRYSSKWENGLRNLAIDLRDLANEVFLHCPSNLAVGRPSVPVPAKHKTKVPHFRQREGALWEGRFRRLAWDVKEHPLKAYLKSRDKAGVLQSSVSKPPSASSSSLHRSGFDPTRRECALNDFVSELKKVSRKVRNGWSPKRNKDSSHRPPRSTIQGTETGTTYSRVSKLDEVHGPVAKRNQSDSSMYQDPYGTEPLGMEFQQPAQLKKKSVPGSSSYSNHPRVYTQGENHQSNSKTALRGTGDYIFEDLLSSWGFGLRSLVQAIDQVAQSSRGKTLPGTINPAVPQLQSFEFWAGTKSGQSTLSTWERKLLALSNEMREVSGKIRDKCISEPERRPEKVTSVSPRTYMPGEKRYRFPRKANHSGSGKSKLPSE